MMTFIFRNFVRHLRAGTGEQKREKVANIGRKQKTL
jgi:hypothetical protein